MQSIIDFFTNMDPKKRKLIFTVFFGALALVSIVGFFERVFLGHESANYGSYVVWGLWVSAYIYFIGLSAGAFLLSSLIYAFGMKSLEKLGLMALYIALTTLVMALLSIFFDLGREWRFYRVFTSPNFQSMMAWMIWLYTSYFVLLSFEFYFAIKPTLSHKLNDPGITGKIANLLIKEKRPLLEAEVENCHRWLRVLGTIGVPLAITFHGGVGALFATNTAHPYWHHPLMPVIFLIGALASGSALLLFLFAFFWPKRDEYHLKTLQLLGKITLGLMIFELVLEWAEFSIPMWYRLGSEYELMMDVLFGQYWYVFWIIHILIGTAIPMYFIIKKSNSYIHLGIAGALTALTFLAVRLNLVVPALTHPEIKALEDSFQDHRLTFAYAPSLFEWQVTLAIFFIGAAIFYFGLRYLPLTEEGGSK